MRWLPRLWRKKVGNRLSCNVQVGEYIYTCTVQVRNDQSDRTVFQHHCQVLALHLEFTSGINHLPETIAIDWFKGMLDRYSCYFDVGVTWKEIERNVSET